MSGKRIHVFGGPGSGKTTLAKKLAAEQGLPHIELDALFWDDEGGGYAVRRDPAERDRRLARLVETDAWIIEGVYWGWCRPSFERAEQILLLDTPHVVRQWRMALRFLKRKSGLEKSLEKQRLKGYLDSVRWNARWDRANLAGAKEVLKQFEAKVSVV